MYHMIYNGLFVTGMDRQNIVLNEDCENRLQFNTRKQAMSTAEKSGWALYVEIHADDEQAINVYAGNHWKTTFYASPKERQFIRERAQLAGVWDALNRPLSVTKSRLGRGYIATFS